MSDLERRLERVEAQLSRILELLERPGSPAAAGTVSSAAAAAEAQLASVYGQPVLRDQLSDLLIRLQDPEVMESLTRVAVLVPRIEYALQAVAAGPELLEEALDLARAQLGDGEDMVMVQYRLNAAVRSLKVLAEPRVVEVIGGLAAGLPDVAPFVGAATQAGQRLATVETPAALKERLSDALVRLAETETLDSLLRIAELAPQIEYAVNFLAAGPALLEDGMADVRSRLRAAGADVSEVDRRLEALLKALPQLSAPRVVNAASDLAGLLPVLRPLTTALGRATQQLGEVESQEALTERLAETIVAITEEETLASLTRLAQLAPHLEYAAQFAAAGPGLLEDAMAMVQKWTADNGHDGVRVEDRLNEAAKVLFKISEPQALRGIGRLAEAVEPSLRDRETMEALAKILELLPSFSGPLQSLSRAVPDVDVGAVVGLLEAAKRTDVQHAIKGLVELAPQLERPLRALPFQPHTLEVLKTLNEAVESGATQERRAGVFSLLGALRDPEIQRATGFLLYVAHELGSHLGKSNGLSNGTNGHAQLPPAF